MPKNKLAPDSFMRRLWDFFTNLCWSVVWLGRWTIRLLKRIIKK